MIKLSPPAALILALAGAAPARAHAVPPDCGNAPREQWMSEDAIKARGLALGYDVGAVRVEGGCYELQSVNKTKISSTSIRSQAQSSRLRTGNDADQSRRS